jgi:hypothetical protein
MRPLLEVPITDDLPAGNAELEQLERRIAELEADISLISGVIEHLERFVPDKRPLCAPVTRHDHWDDNAREVDTNLFAEDLRMPQEDL